MFGLVFLRLVGYEWGVVCRLLPDCFAHPIGDDVYGDWVYSLIPRRTGASVSATAGATSTVLTLPPVDPR